MANFDGSEWQEPWAWSEDHACSSHQPPVQQVAMPVSDMMYYGDEYGMEDDYGLEMEVIQEQPTPQN